MVRIGFLPAVWSERWAKSYRKLPAARQVACDEAILALIKQDPTPGMRVKPIQPEKHYLEARISSGDRLVFRLESGILYFVEVVSHDDVDRLARRSPRRA